eukprot:TRINITY_DN9424_c0_g1_i1.p1 TRINITY_DN9424_c0_g1~~TRINITY_DN9424_c0_g1_i1.p1  ORF type:complete len:111 (-),score=14.82 TRINITY_DN9424_c0_g1_i1:20-352(-)
MAQTSVADVFSPEKMAEVSRIVNSCRTIVSTFGGMTAGILGLYGFTGIFFYVILTIVLGAMILFLKSSPKGQWTTHFRHWSDVMTDGMFTGLFTFIMFWTLLYDIVHIYV